MSIVLAAIPAAVTAAAGKAAAGVGITAAGTAAGYGVIRAIQKAEEPTPQISDSILSSASETESESLITFNFGGTASTLVIVSVVLVGSFITWRCCRCCLPRCCQTNSMTQKEAQRQAILGIASMAMNQQQ